MSLLKAMVFKLWGMKHTDHKIAQAESAEFKDVNITVGEAYKQATKIILRIKDFSTFIGEEAGKITTGNRNNFMGYDAGYSNTTGYNNNFMGSQAGYRNTLGYYNNFMGVAAGYTNTTGNYNNFMGAYVGYYNTTGSNNNFMGNYAGYLNISGNYNNFMGARAGYANTTGYRNNFMGYRAGHANTTGYNNNFMGAYAGYRNITGNNNNFLGVYAGYHETSSNKLFIDNQERIDEADGRVKALIYGIFDAATANQRLRINGRLGVTEIPEYADNAAAVTGGLSVGEFYRSGDLLKVVH